MKLTPLFSILLLIVSCTGSGIKKNTTSDVTIYPQRIISASPLITEVIFALDKGDKLVGRTDYCTYPKDAENVDRIGGVTNPSIETIVSLKPDLMITSTHFRAEIRTQLKQLGVPIINILNQTSISGAYATIKEVGILTDATLAADSLVLSMKHQIDSLQLLIPNRNNKPTVYYVVGFGKNGDFTGGGNTFINELIQLSGGTNIASSLKGWSYSLEKLIEKDPDIIILPNGWKEAFCNHPNYINLYAIKTNNVFEVEKNIFEINGPRIVQAVDTLIEILHYN